MGVVFICLLVNDASSKAVRSPRMVTISALSLRAGCIVMMGVFIGVILEVISRPATILPQARRLIGLITAELFSLMGDRGRKRGWPIETKKTTRRLYTAVKEVASSVRVRAQAFRWDVFMASIIASLEKKPARKGVPVSARLPIVRQVDVKGVRWCMPPILRMSCSSPRLWIIDPEQRKSIALKNACVQMWRKASCGWFRPIVTIMSPSWLEVENATIFLISFWVRAHVAVKRVVSAPKHKQVVRAIWLSSINGFRRIRRKIPATTIVLEWSRAETGVGPSIADGSHGCKPNWADLPVAAKIRPIIGSVRSMFLEEANICWISQELRFVASHAMVRIRPISPTRL